MNKKNLATFLISILVVLTSIGQTKKEEVKNDISILKSKDLFITILRQDSALFRAFNNCDSGQYRKFFTDDLEFYHDIGGLTVSLESEMRSIKDMCARGTKMRRELIQTGLEIYPIANYGAVEVGSHRFYFTNKGEAEKLGGIYNFVHIWQLKDGVWKISRIVSYGHNKKS
jgi:hypothetical protein